MFPVCGLALDLLMESSDPILSVGLGYRPFQWPSSPGRRPGTWGLGHFQQRSFISSFSVLVKPSSRAQFSLGKFLIGPSSTLGFCIQPPSCGTQERYITLGKNPTHQRNPHHSLRLCEFNLDFLVKLCYGLSEAQPWHPSTLECEVGLFQGTFPFFLRDGNPLSHQSVILGKPWMSDSWCLQSSPQNEWKYIKHLGGDTQKLVACENHSSVIIRLFQTFSYSPWLILVGFQRRYNQIPMMK